MSILQKYKVEFAAAKLCQMLNNFGNIFIFVHYWFLLVLHGCSIVGIHCGIDLLGLPANYSTDWKVLSCSHVGIKQHCQTDPVWCYLNCANLRFSGLETKVKSFPFKKLILNKRKKLNWTRPRR